jgi:hypothetical protein
MNAKDEALLREVLRIVKNPPALGYTQKIKNDEIVREFEDLVERSSEYSLERRNKAQAIVEAKRKEDPAYATPRAKKKIS